MELDRIVTGGGAVARHCPKTIYVFFSSPSDVKNISSPTVKR
jgi:hypothetical protein